MAATTVAVLVRTEELLDARERAVIAAFLAGYTGTTRISYTTDLRQFVTWCTNSGVRLLDVTRAHLETFARHMEADGRMRSTVARRLSTLASFYPVLPHRRRPRTQPRSQRPTPQVDDESRTLGLDRNELGALLVQAGLGTPRDHALITLLAINGLRINEALGADLTDLDHDRGHRTLNIVRKGGKHVTIPLAPRTGRALDLYIGKRASGPLFLGLNGERMDRYAADRIVKHLARRAGITKRISPHNLRHSFITAALDAGVESGSPMTNPSGGAAHGTTTWNSEGPRLLRSRTTSCSSPLARVTLATTR